MIFAILLFFPGGCFLALGAAEIVDPYGSAEDAASSLGLATLLLGLVGILGWAAFRKPSPPATGC